MDRKTAELLVAALLPDEAKANPASLSDLDVRHVRASGSERFNVKDGSEVVGHISVHTPKATIEVLDDAYPQLAKALRARKINMVESIVVNAPYKGKGYGQALYMHAAEQLGNWLVSDIDQGLSPEAERAWVALKSHARVWRSGSITTDYGSRKWYAIKA